MSRRGKRIIPPERVAEKSRRENEISIDFSGSL